MKRTVIVGYDPGITSGLAVLDTKKNILAVDSRRDFTKKEMVEIVTNLGKPVIISSDKFPTPKNVEKFASSMGSKTFRVSESLSVIEKYRLVNPYAERVNNNHERDALAAALKAYDYFEKFFKKADRALSYLGFGEFYDRVVEMIIKGEAENITEALNRIVIDLKEQQDRVLKEKIKVKVEDKTLEELRKTIRTQQNDLNILKKYNENLNKKIEKLEKDMDEERKKHVIKGMDDMNTEIKKVRNMVEGKRKVIGLLKRYREMEVDGKVPLIEVGKVSSFRLADFDKDVGLYKRAVLLEDFENILALNDYNILCAVVDGEIPDDVMGKVSFPLVRSSMVQISEENRIRYLDKKPLDNLIGEAKKQGLKKWIEKYKERR
ncbi:hypothetical protein A3K63_05280 [Candidatus Micrarchaeota archaeon RBG_16_49_10]|nr:MAG: hypothetical protein A3K63_05280 [Candidatus Micrarchaeota archaeon RBG_16_49_10]